MGVVFTFAFAMPQVRMKGFNILEFQTIAVERLTMRNWQGHHMLHGLARSSSSCLAIARFPHPPLSAQVCVLDILRESEGLGPQDAGPFGNRQQPCSVVPLGNLRGGG